MYRETRSKNVLLFLMVGLILILMTAAGLLLNNSTSASAEDADSGYDFDVLTDTDGTKYVRLNAYEGNVYETITVPYTWFDGSESYPVREIGTDCFSAYNTNAEFANIKTIIIPSSIKYIGQAAFWNCTSLSTITWQSGCKLVSIGDYAFYGCKALTSITIPSTVTSIGKNAFYIVSGQSGGVSNVTFENTEGWYIVADGATGKNYLSASDLADTILAANYLTSNFKLYYWYNK